MLVIKIILELMMCVLIAIIFYAIAFDIPKAIKDISHEIYKLTNTVSLVYQYLDAERGVSIVHCGECKFRSHEEGDWHSCLLHGGIKLPEKHFCSDGEVRYE